MLRVCIALRADAEDHRILVKIQKPFYIRIFFFPGNQIYKTSGHGPAFSGYYLRIPRDADRGRRHLRASREPVSVRGSAHRIQYAHHSLRPVLRVPHTGQYSLLHADSRDRRADLLYGTGTAPSLHAAQSSRQYIPVNFSPLRLRKAASGSIDPNAASFFYSRISHAICQNASS